MGRSIRQSAKFPPYRTFLTIASTAAAIGDSCRDSNDSTVQVTQLLCSPTWTSSHQKGRVCFFPRQLERSTAPSGRTKKTLSPFRCSWPNEQQSTMNLKILNLPGCGNGVLSSTFTREIPCDEQEWTPKYLWLKIQGHLTLHRAPMSYWWCFREICAKPVQCFSAWPLS